MHRHSSPLQEMRDFTFYHKLELRHMEDFKKDIVNIT